MLPASKTNVFVLFIILNTDLANNSRRNVEELRALGVIRYTRSQEESQNNDVITSTT